MFISVDLPEPEAPIRATNSPRSMVSETPLRTGTSTSPRWYVLWMSVSLISDMFWPSLLLAEQLRRERVAGGAALVAFGLADHHLGALLDVALDDLGHQPV